MEIPISADSLREYAESVLNEGPALEAIRERSDKEIEALIEKNIDERDLNDVVATAESVVLSSFVQEYEF